MDIRGDASVPAAIASDPFLPSQKNRGAGKPPAGAPTHAGIPRPSQQTAELHRLSPPRSGTCSLSAGRLPGRAARQRPSVHTHPFRPRLHPPSTHLYPGRARTHLPSTQTCLWAAGSHIQYPRTHSAGYAGLGAMTSARTGGGPICIPIPTRTCAGAGCADTARASMTPATRITFRAFIPVISPLKWYKTASVLSFCNLHATVIRRE